MINIDDLEKSLVSSMICSGNLPCDNDYSKFKKLILTVSENEFKGLNKWLVKAVKKITKDSSEAPTINEVDLFLQANISSKDKLDVVLAHMYGDVLTYSPMIYNVFDYYLNMFYKQKALIKLQGV